ncbi:hypothetical protein NP493_2472g00009 [Ridgeia piscesae]|uniref:EGF-like domain-containing protein n=1 Tax=Ridgeia piscesae TaxID=27915 RepID=A0AAD9N2Z0_RIDPI|nr:hypothetical protein NP493_2472g00009 [Ridgeia piscesae]
MNGATCQDQVNGYSCTCAAGYTGDRCESVPTTSTSPPTTTEKASEMTQSSESVDGTTNASGESTNETPTTTTTPVVTTTTPLIPYTDLARVNVKVKVKLTSIDYTSDLADKTSDVYKSLKTTVVDTLMEVLASELGQGDFDIVDVTFR